MPKKRKSPKPENLTVEILKQIRDGVTRLDDGLNQQIETLRADLVEAIGRTNDRVDALTLRVDALGDRVDALGNRLTATEMRLATQHVAILGALEQLQSTIADAVSRDAAINDLDERVSAADLRIAALEQKAGVGQ